MIGVTGAFRGCTGIVGLSVRKSEDKAKSEGAGKVRNGTRAASPQHNAGMLAHYLSVVYYYLVGTSFETGTRK